MEAIATHSYMGGYPPRDIAEAAHTGCRHPHPAHLLRDFHHRIHPRGVLHGVAPFQARHVDVSRRSHGRPSGRASLAHLEVEFDPSQQIEDIQSVDEFLQDEDSSCVERCTVYQDPKVGALCMLESQDEGK